MLFTRRRQEATVPEVGAEAPEFNLPSAQGGQLRLSMRTVRGPVVVAFLRGMWSEEDVGFFSELAAKEDEINHAGGSVVGIGAVEPDEAREFARASGLKSYVLYDYQRVTAGQWGLLDRDKEHGQYARPAVFVVGADGRVAHAWVGERPSPDELLAAITGITGLPKPAEEEKPEEAAGAAASAGAAVEEKPKKLSAEERERIKAERRAAREAGKSVKTSGQASGAAAAEAPATEAPGAQQAAGGGAGEKPQKMSAEERERIKAERRAARESGKSVKTGAPESTAGAAGGEAAGETEKPKKMSAEERERIKAERRAAREAGKSLKQPAATPEAGTQATNEDASPVAETTEPPKPTGE